MNKYATALLHLMLFALVTAIGAYWAVRIFTPQPIAAPPPLAAPPPREPDPIAAARMFGLIQVAVAAVTNIQVAGIFAAGKDSSAILTVDGKPPRAFILGQEIAPGTTLVAVRPDGVTLDRGVNGGQQELRAPPLPPSMSFSTQGPSAVTPAYQRQGNTLTVDPTLAGSSASHSFAPAPTFQPPPQAVESAPQQQEQQEAPQQQDQSSEQQQSSSEAPPQQE